MVQYLNGNIHETFIKTPVCHIHLVMLMPAVENANACKGNFFSPSRYISQTKNSEIMYDVIILNKREQRQLSQSYQKYYSLKFQTMQVNGHWSLAQVFFCEFYKISKNNFFTEHIRTTAFDICVTYAILCTASMLRKDTLPKISLETQQIKNLMFLIDVLTKYCLT